MKGISSACGLIALIFLIIVGPAEANFTVSGAILMADVAPGQHITHVMYIGSGEFESPRDIRVEVNGFGQDLNGANNDIQANLDASPFSARPFIRVYPNQFRLEPGAIERVLIEVDVPQDVGEGGGKYALVSIISSPLDLGVVALRISVDVPVLLTINGTEKKMTGDIADLLIQKPALGVCQNVSIMLNNTGNYHYKAYAEAILVHHNINFAN